MAYINHKEEVNLKGVLLSLDGTKKLEAEFTAALGKHEHIARDCANSILSRGGKHLMGEIQRDSHSTDVFSTKKLTQDQRLSFLDGIQVESEDFIKTSPTRIPIKVLKTEMQNVVITSKNAVEALLTNVSADELQFKNIYCVGRRTKRLIEKRIGKVKHFEKNAQKLADHMVDYLEGTEVTYFCSNLRLDDLPNVLTKNNIIVNEIEAYKTKYSPVEVGLNVKGVLFFSPSTVESYMQMNKADKIAYCIGESTAKAAREHFTDVRVAKIPMVESVVDLVNEDYSA